MLHLIVNVTTVSGLLLF